MDRCLSIQTSSVRSAKKYEKKDGSPETKDKKDKEKKDNEKPDRKTKGKKDKGKSNRKESDNKDHQKRTGGNAGGSRKSKKSKHWFGRFLGDP